MLQAARHYGANYLLLDMNRPPPLTGLYEGKLQLPQLHFVAEFGEGYYLYKIVEPPAEDRTPHLR
jgi:hypothetical protein